MDYLWSVIGDLEYQAQYIDLYHRHINRINKFATFILAVFASGTFVSLVVWQEHATLFSVLTALSALFQLYYQKSTVARLLPCISCYAQDARKVANRAAELWFECSDDESKVALVKKANEVSEAFDELERIYSDKDIHIGVVPWLQSRAVDLTNTALDSKFGKEEEEK